MFSDRRLLAWMMFALICALTASRPALAGGDGGYATHRVSYQCPNESPQVFTYAGGDGDQYGTAPLEAKWYWARTRADHGAGCKIVQVDGLPLQ